MDGLTQIQVVVQANAGAVGLIGLDTQGESGTANSQAHGHPRATPSSGQGSKKRRSEADRTEANMRARAQESDPARGVVQLTWLDHGRGRIRNPCRLSSAASSIEPRCAVPDPRPGNIGGATEGASCRGPAGPLPSATRSSRGPCRRRRTFPRRLDHSKPF
jgi:hypothetical protein